MNKHSLVFILAGVVWLVAGIATANNIRVSKISLTGQNTTDKYVMVRFDLSWENSWHFSNGPANLDTPTLWGCYEATLGGTSTEIVKYAKKFGSYV